MTRLSNQGIIYLSTVLCSPYLAETRVLRRFTLEARQGLHFIYTNHVLGEWLRAMFQSTHVSYVSIVIRGNEFMTGGIFQRSLVVIHVSGLRVFTPCKAILTHGFMPVALFHIVTLIGRCIYLCQVKPLPFPS